MNTSSEFRNHIMSGNKDDNVSNEALSYFKNNATYSVIDKRATADKHKNQSKIINVSLTGQEYSDDELEERVKRKLTDGKRDIQKRDLMFGNKIPTKIEIWRHGSGYSAFAEV